MTAYRIIFTALFILSSFPPESIISTAPHTMNAAARNQATRTTNETPTRMISGSPYTLFAASTLF